MSTFLSSNKTERFIKEQITVYLIKMVKPPEGKVLDPFMGSGSTGISCRLNKFDFIGIEREDEYYKLAKERIKTYKPDEFKIENLKIVKVEKEFDGWE